MTIGQQSGLTANRDKRIFSTGCAGEFYYHRFNLFISFPKRGFTAAYLVGEVQADRPTWTDENARMTDCYFEKKDWRACAKEVCDSLIQDRSPRQLINLADGRVQAVLEASWERAAHRVKGCVGLGLIHTRSSSQDTPGLDL